MRAGWNSIKLADAVEVLNGFAFKSSRYVPEGIRVIRISNVQKGYVEDKDPKFYPVSSKDEIRKYLLQEGDLLMSLTGNVGRVGLLPGSMLPCALNQRVACLRMKSAKLSKMFLFYLLNSNVFEAMCIKSSSGVAQLNMSTEWLKEQIIPLPSLPEQQRIVEILDNEFFKVEALKANAEKSLQAAKDLFQATLKKELELKDGWETDQLKNICTIKPPKKEAFRALNDASPVSFLPMEDLEVMDFDIQPKQAKPLGEISGSYTYFAEGDVLLAKVTPCFENGKQGIARHLTNGVGFGSSEFIVYRPGERIRAEFLYYYLASNDFRERGKKQMHGACGLKRLAKEIVENSVISFPDPDSQDEIVRKIRDNEERTAKLQENYQKTLTLCDDLKQALLRKAFNGEL